MKTNKKLLAILLTFVMLVGMMVSLPVSAAGTGVTGSVVGDSNVSQLSVSSPALTPILWFNGKTVEKIGNEDTFAVEFAWGWTSGEPVSVGITSEETGEWYYFNYDATSTTWDPLTGTAFITGVNLLKSWAAPLTPGRYFFYIYCWNDEIEDEEILISDTFLIIEGSASQQEDDPGSGTDPDPILQSIVVTPPVKTDYFVGESLDLTGLTVTAKYDIGDDSVVSGWTAEPSDGTILTTENDTVLISYEDKTASFEITVITPESEPAQLTVSVSTPTIVETLSAYLNITLTGEDVDYQKLTAYLSVEGELSYATPIDENGYGRMFIGAAPEAGNYEIVVSAEDKSAEGSCVIEVTAYDTDIWVMQTTINEAGYVVLIFNEDIAAKDGKFDKEVSISLKGMAVTCTLGANGKSLITSVLYDDLQSGDYTLTAAGVKYPRLFPSYSFTFTAEISKQHKM